MADTPTTSTPTIWASTISHIGTIHAQLHDVPGYAGALERRLLWDEQLHGQDQVSGQKTLILDDLRRLAAA